VQQTIGGPYTATVAGTAAITAPSPVTGLLRGFDGLRRVWVVHLPGIGNAYTPDPATPQNGNAQDASAPLVYEQVIFNPSWKMARSS